MECNLIWYRNLFFITCTTISACGTGCVNMIAVNQYKQKNLFDETKWWTWRDSNSLPLRCERSALPDELQARVKKRIDCTHRQRQTKMIVNHGVEAGAGEGTWTHTRQEPVPKTGASTNSATPARYALLYHRYGCLSIYMTWNFCLTEGISVVCQISY